MPRFAAAGAVAAHADFIYWDWYQCALDLDLAYWCEYRAEVFCAIVSDGEVSVW